MFCTVTILIRHYCRHKGIALWLGGDSKWLRDYHSTVCGTTFPRAYKALSLFLWGMGNEYYLLTWNVGGRYSTCPCFSKPSCIWIQTAHTWLVESNISNFKDSFPFPWDSIRFQCILGPRKKEMDVVFSFCLLWIPPLFILWQDDIRMTYTGPC